MPKTMENIPYSNYHRNGLRKKKSERALGMRKNNRKWTILFKIFFCMSLGSIFQSKRNISQGEAGKSNADLSSAAL